MPVFNKGTSTYHTTQGLYWRNATGTLLAIEGINSEHLPTAWPDLYSEISSATAQWTRTQHLPSGKSINTLEITKSLPALEHIRSNFPPNRQKDALITKVSEIQRDDGLVLGMVTTRPAALADNAFSIWADNFILSETEFQPFAQLSQDSDAEHRATSEKIADIFVEKLKNVSKDDQWDVCGREKFLNRVYGFVEKNAPILLALPAFPCKSPNTKKVGGIMPDMAEHIALDVLRDFVKEVNAVYAPGATLWVISDGHVFSDCIGADDALIDDFDAKMVELYKSKYSESGPAPAISFKGLKDIFLSSPSTLGGFKDRWLGSDVPHPVATSRTHDAELCRKLMLGVGGADRAYIRQCIVESEPHALQLYRGQTRFMLEDLAEVPSVKALSNKQKKKTAADVAQEMMSRNQAYSNLVELLLPNYVRLSIHAHPNKGPKFAVRLLPKTMVRPIENLANRHEPVAAYEFQIPTPWHNAIIKVEGDEMLYLARAEVAKAAIVGTDFEGEWVDGPAGSYFHLTRTTAAEDVSPPTPLARRPTMASVGRGVGAFLRLRKKPETVQMEAIPEPQPSPVLSEISVVSAGAGERAGAGAGTGEKASLRISTQFMGAPESNGDSLSPMVDVKPLQKNRRSMSWFSSKSPSTRSPMNRWSSRPVVSAV